MNLSILDACTQKKRNLCELLRIRIWSRKRGGNGSYARVRSQVRMAVQVSPPAWFARTLAALIDRRDLSGIHMCEVMHGLLHGDCGAVETAALLVALAMK